MDLVSILIGIGLGCGISCGISFILLSLLLSNPLQEAKARLSKLKDEHDKWMNSAKEADSCLLRMREWLESKGVEMTHTPPLLYPEACQSVLSRGVREHTAKQCLPSSDQEERSE